MGSKIHSQESAPIGRPPAAATGRNVGKEVGVVSAMFSVDQSEGRPGSGLDSWRQSATGRNVLVKLTGKQYRKTVLYKNTSWSTDHLGCYLGTLVPIVYEKYNRMCIYA